MSKFIKQYVVDNCKKKYGRYEMYVYYYKENLDLLFIID